MFRYLEDLVLLILLIYIARNAFRLLVGHLLGRAGRNRFSGKNWSESQANANEPFEAGRIKVKYAPPVKPKKVNDKEGEFVSYEEVKSSKTRE